MPKGGEGVSVCSATPLPPAAPPPGQGGVLRWLSAPWLRVGVSLGLFALLLGLGDIQAFLRQLRATRLDWFLLIFVGYLAGQALSAYKWRLLAQPLGFDQSLRAFLVYYFVGMYLNLFAPSTVAGDLGRGLLLAEHNRWWPTA